MFQWNCKLYCYHECKYQKPSFLCHQWIYTNNIGQIVTAFFDVLSENRYGHGDLHVKWVPRQDTYMSFTEKVLKISWWFFTL